MDFHQPIEAVVSIAIIEEEEFVFNRFVIETQSFLVEHAENYSG